METVDIDRLVVTETPRLAGEDLRHTQLLAQSQAELPPILVDRRTMTVIDGVHRLHAMRLRKERRIGVRYYDGSRESAFVLAVESNIAHGLPLTLADREAAARQIIVTHAHWSDRRIAEVTGLSARSVAAMRNRATADLPQLVKRVGRDGRARPTDATEGRLRAMRVIESMPGASIRRIAREAGISPGTARDVRERLRRGDGPLPSGRRGHRTGSGGAGCAGADGQRCGSGTPPRAVRNRTLLLARLHKDPSLRFTDAGRKLLRWLNLRAAGPEGWQAWAGNVPPHCVPLVVDLARACSQEWFALARQLEEQPAPNTPPGVRAPATRIPWRADG